MAYQLYMCRDNSADVCHSVPGHAGFIVDTISYQGINFTTWEVGGRSGNVSDYLYSIKYWRH